MTLPILGAPVESGCYYNPVSSGHGWDVHTHDNRTVIFWYTGDENPVFMFARGVAGEELDLIRMVGGTVDNPSGAIETKVGTCRFTGNVFCFVLNGVRGGIEVVQLVAPETSGIYYYAPRNGEGIGAHEFERDGQKCCVVFFYTYTHNRDTWLSFEGVWNGAFYDLVAYETHGEFHRYGAKTKPAGKGQLVKLESGVRFSFQIDSGRDETYVMEKLF